MKKLFIIPAVVLIILFYTSTVHSSPSLNENDLVSICNEVYDSFIPNKYALSDKSYIAIDMTTMPFKNMTASSKLQILNHMKKYETNYLNVIASSMEDLRAKGLVDKNNELNLNGIKGIYLSINSVDIMKNGDVSLIGMWFSGPRTAEEMKFVLRNDNGSWKVKERTLMREP